MVGGDPDWIEVEVKNRFSVGDILELMTPAGNVSFAAEALQNPSGEPIEVAPGSGYQVRVPRPPGVGSLEHALLTVDLARRNNSG